MSIGSGIEWCTATWNPIVGCTRVSKGCEHCYAERTAKRMIAMGVAHYQGLLDHNGRWNGKVAMAEHKLKEPLGWKLPQTVFVNSMGDLFHENVPDECITRVFCVIGQCYPLHKFVVLTKRPERMRDYLSQWSIDGYHRNLAIGVSVEDQRTADERIPLLLQTPARWRFVSYEPALGPVDFSKYLLNQVSHVAEFGGNRPASQHYAVKPPLLNGIIMGGESGPKARPMHPDWARSTRDACADAGVIFFFKQWGEWSPLSQHESFVPSGYVPSVQICRNLEYAMRITSYLSIDGNLSVSADSPSSECVLKVGKKESGRLLDGREHNDLPWEQAA